MEAKPKDLWVVPFTRPYRVRADIQRLFERYPDRFLLGSDTWIDQRWDSYGSIMADYRSWLAQLPQGVAEKIAFRNAERLFKR